MLIVTILYHAKSRLMEIADISSDEKGKTVATTGDNLGTRLQFTFDDPEDTLEGYGARVDFDVLLMNQEGMTYKPFIMLNSEGYVDIPDGILSQVKCGKLPIQLVFGKAVGETDYRFNSLNQIELAVNRAINSTNVPPEDVPGVEDAVVQVDYDSEDATFTFTRLDGSLITITLSDLHDDHFEVQTQADLITLDEAETGDTATALDTGVWYKLYGAYDVLDNWYPMPGGATMNGQPVTFPTFYAPIDSGTDGQYLESKGENSSPVWKDKVTAINGSMQGSNVPTATAVKTYTDAEVGSERTRAEGVEQGLQSSKVDKTTKVNGHALSSDVTVSKADVGLGNADNTSDLNKPVSTATQNALNQKVNKSDVTVPATIPTLAWGQTSSLGSVDGKSFQVTMPANPDTDVKVRQSLQTGNYNLPLLLAHDTNTTTTVDITDIVYRNNSIYANPSTASIYAQTFFANNKEVAVDENVVHKTGNETIAGVKTHQDGLALQNTAYTLGVTPTAYLTKSFQIKDFANTVFAGMDFVNNTNDVNAVEFNIRTKGSSGWLSTRFSMKRSSTEAYMTIPTRTYNASNTSDVVTIGSLQSSTDVVHTIGSETIAGTKVFTGGLLIGDPNITTASWGPELYGATPFIDFHHNSSGADYTSRIINSNDGDLSLIIRDDAGVNTRGMTLHASGYITGYGRGYASADSTDILIKAHVPDIISANVSNQQISLTSSRGVAVDSFTLNQMSGKNIVLPASSTQYQNQSVTFSAQSPADFSDYPYMASLSVTGLTADMYATVTFSDAQASSGQYAPFCQTVAGAVRLYAKSNVGTQTIPTISIGMDDSSAQQSMSNFVTLAGAQTIGGAKTFTSAIVSETIKSVPKLTAKITNVDVTDGTASFMNGLQFNDKNGVALCSYDLRTYTDGRVSPYVNTRRAGGGIKTSYFPDGRAYVASDTDVIATIGTLQASTDLLHTAGNETKTGNLILTGVTGIMGMYNNKASENIESTSTWRRLYYNAVTPANQMLLLVVTPQKPAISPNEYGILMIGGTANNPPICKWIVKGVGIILNNFVMVYSETTGFELWIKNENGNRGICVTRLTETNWGSITNNWSVDNTTTDPSFDYTTYPYYKVSE